MIRQYCVYTKDPEFLQVASWLDSTSTKYEPHLNRTRFWIPEGPVLTEFLLKWGDCCPEVKEQVDRDYLL